MLQSKGRRRRRHRCYRRRRRGHRCCTHGCQARGDSGNCLSRRQVRRFSDLHPNLSCPKRSSRRLTSESCSRKQHSQLRSGSNGARCHRHHALHHSFTFISSGRCRRRRSQEQLTVRTVGVCIARISRTCRSGRKCSGRGSMGSCGCMCNS